MATFMAAIPVSSLIGSPVSGLMLDIDWGGLPGWRWIFILQGVAPVVAGFVTLFYLSDRPETARWLPPDEKEWLLGELRTEALAKRRRGHWEWLGQAGTVLLLTAFYFCMNVTSYGLSIFMPTILQTQLPGLSDTMASVLAGLPYVMGLAGMLINGWHSDKTRERIGHAVVPLTCLSISIFLAAQTDGYGLAPALIMIFLVGTFLYAHHPAFWPIPSAFLGATAAASAIGFINMIGTLGGFFGPAMMGSYVEQHQLANGLTFLSGFPLAAVCIILFVGWVRRPARTRPELKR